MIRRLIREQGLAKVRSKSRMRSAKKRLTKTQTQIRQTIAKERNFEDKTCTMNENLCHFLTSHWMFSSLFLCPQILSIQAEGCEGAEASKSVSSSHASPLLKMCVYTFY